MVQSSNNFRKSFILDAWFGSEFASANELDKPLKPNKIIIITQFLPEERLMVKRSNSLVTKKVDWKTPAVILSAIVGLIHFFTIWQSFST